MCHLCSFILKYEFPAEVQISEYPMADGRYETPQYEPVRWFIFDDSSMKPTRENPCDVIKGESGHETSSENNEVFPTKSVTVNRPKKIDK